MKERLRAYREYLKIHHPQAKELILEINYSKKNTESVRLISDFIFCNPQMDSILFATNYLGISGLESIRNLQLQIPEDLAVICFDDHYIFKFFTPAITIIEQPLATIAKKAVSLLLNEMNGKKTE